MARAQGLLPSRQGALEEALRIPVLPLVSIQSCPGSEGLAAIGVVCRERVLADDEGALEEPRLPVAIQAHRELRVVRRFPTEKNAVKQVRPQIPKSPRHRASPRLARTPSPAPAYPWS